MITLNGLEIKPTMFPDKTSQVWKIDTNYIAAFNLIIWDFESEAELIHVAQLKQLITALYPNSQNTLKLPYLPYARQDKEISNETTFALHTFALFINALQFSSVMLLDPHSGTASELIKRASVIDPQFNMLKILHETESIPCFPDAGAMGRYHQIANVHNANLAICDKVRDQLTGDIIGLNTTGKVQQTRYLIIDDICDGGRTFIEAAKALYAAGATEVNLYITHGIFSKGTQVLRDAGIKRIFTYKGEVNE
jgi:ribose-phosphate pyrophosphokinase